MNPANNVFKRIKGIFLNPKETLQEIADAPTNWGFIFLLFVGFLALFFFYLIHVPTALNSIIITAGSPMPDYLIVLSFLGVIVVLTGIYFLILFIISLIGIRLRRSRPEHRSKKVILNLYIYSLSPLIILLTQIPFILIFGGYYTLFNLSFFFYFLLGLVIGWHVFLLHHSIQANSDISPRRAKLLAIVYISLIGAFACFLIYAILYIPFDISWLGQLM